MFMVEKSSSDFIYTTFCNLIISSKLYCYINIEYYILTEDSYRNKKKTDLVQIRLNNLGEKMT